MKKVIKSFPSIVSLTLLIQLLGLIRSVFLSNDLGATIELDAFYLANILTISVFSVVSSSISTVMIPSLISEKKNKSKKSSTEYLIAILVLAILFSTLLFLFLLIFINFINPNFNNQLKFDFLLMVISLLFSQLFRILSTYFMSMLQIRSKYFLSRLPNIIPSAFPLMYIFLSKDFYLLHFVYILSVSYFFEMTFYILISNIKFPQKFNLNLKLDDHTIQMLKNTVPILAGSAVFQVQIIVINYFAGFFGSGFITILSNTNQIVGIFQGLLVANIFTLVYPQMVSEIKNNLNVGLKRTEIYIGFTNVIVIFLVWGYAAVGKDLVSFLFYRGNFSLQSTNSVYIFGLILMIGLPFSVIRDYIYRVYYALDNTSKPTKNAILTVILNIFLLVTLSFFIDEYSLVISTSIGTIISLYNIIKQARKDKLFFNWRKVTLLFIYLNVLAFLMFSGIIIWGIDSENNLLNLITNTSIGIIIFLLILGIHYILYRKNFFKNFYHF